MYIECKTFVETMVVELSEEVVHIYLVDGKNSVVSLTTQVLSSVSSKK